MYVYRFLKLIDEGKRIRCRGGCQPWMGSSRNFIKSMKNSRFSNDLLRVFPDNKGIQDLVLLPMQEQDLRRHQGAHDNYYEGTRDVVKMLRGKFKNFDARQTAQDVREALRDKLSPNLNAYISYIERYRGTGSYSADPLVIFMGLQYFLERSDNNAVLSLLQEGMTSGYDGAKYSPSCMKGLLNRIAAQIKITMQSDQSVITENDDGSNYAFHLFKHYESGDEKKALITAMWQVMVDDYVAQHFEEDTEYDFYGTDSSIDDILKQLRVAANGYLDGHTYPEVCSKWAENKGFQVKFDQHDIVQDYLGKHVKIKSNQLVKITDNEESELSKDDIQNSLMSYFKLDDKDGESLKDIVDQCMKATDENKYEVLQKYFRCKINTDPVGYWIDQQFISPENLKQFLTEKLLSSCETGMYDNNKPIFASDLLSALTGNNTETMVAHYNEYQAYSQMSHFLKDVLGSDVSVYQGSIYIGRDRADEDQLKKRVLYNLCMDQSKKIPIRKLLYQNQDVEVNDDGKEHWFKAKYQDQIDGIFSKIMVMANDDNDTQKFRMERRKYFSQYLGSANFDTQQKKFSFDDNVLDEQSIKNHIVNVLKERSYIELERVVAAIKAGEDVKIPDGFELEDTGDYVNSFVHTDLIDQVLPYEFGQNTIYDVAEKLKMDFAGLRCVLQTQGGIKGLYEAALAYVGDRGAIFPPDEFKKLVNDFEQKRISLAKSYIATDGHRGEFCVFEDFEPRVSTERLADDTRYKSCMQYAIHNKKPDKYFSEAPMLQHAILNGDRKSFDALIKLGPNIYARDDWDTNLMMVAANCGEAEMFSGLLNLYDASRSSIFNYLKPDLLKQQDFYGRNVLVHACMSGNIDIVKELVSRFKESGLNIDAVSKHHDNAMFLACENNHPEVVKHLLDNGSTLNLSYMLYFCVKNDLLEVVKVFKNHFKQNQDIKVPMTLKRFLKRLLGVRYSSVDKDWQYQAAKEAVLSSKPRSDEMLKTLYDPEHAYRLEAIAIKNNRVDKCDVLLSLRSYNSEIEREYKSELLNSDKWHNATSYGDLLFKPCGGVILAYIDLTPSELESTLTRIEDRIKKGNIHDPIRRRLFDNCIKKSTKVSHLVYCLDLYRNNLNDGDHEMFDLMCGQLEKILQDSHNVSDEQAQQLYKFFNLAEKLGCHAVDWFLKHKDTIKYPQKRIIAQIDLVGLIRNSGNTQLAELIDLGRKVTPDEFCKISMCQQCSLDTIRKMLENVSKDQVPTLLVRLYTGFLSDRPNKALLQRDVDVLNEIIGYMLDQPSAFHFLQSYDDGQTNDAYTVLEIAAHLGSSEYVKDICKILGGDEKPSGQLFRKALSAAISTCDDSAIEKIRALNDEPFPSECLYKALDRDIDVFDMVLNHVKFPLESDVFESLKLHIEKDSITDRVQKLLAQKPEGTKFSYANEQDAINFAIAALNKDKIDVFNLFIKNIKEFGVTEKLFTQQVVKRFIEWSKNRSPFRVYESLELLKSHIDDEAFQSLMVADNGKILNDVLSSNELSRHLASKIKFDDNLEGNLKIIDRFLLFCTDNKVQFPKSVWQSVYKGTDQEIYLDRMRSLALSNDTENRDLIIAMINPWDRDMAWSPTFLSSMTPRDDMKCAEIIVKKMLDSGQIEYLANALDKLTDNRYEQVIQFTSEKCDDLGLIYKISGAKGINALMAKNGNLQQTEGGVKFLNTDKVYQWHDETTKIGYLQLLQRENASVFISAMNAFNINLDTINSNDLNVVQGDRRLRQGHVMESLYQKVSEGHPTEGESDKDRLIAQVCYERLKDLISKHCDEDKKAELNVADELLDKFFNNENVKVGDVSSALIGYADVITSISDKVDESELETLWSKFAYLMYQILNIFGLFPNQAKEWKETHDKIINIEKQERDDEVHLINRELKSFAEKIEPAINTVDNEENAVRSDVESALPDQKDNPLVTTSNSVDNASSEIKIIAEKCPDYVKIGLLFLTVALPWLVYGSGLK